MWEILGFREWERNQCAKVIKEQQKERESSLKNRTVLEHTYLHKRFLENKWVMFGLLCLALIHDPHSIWFYSPSRFFIYKKQRKYRSHLFRPKKSNQIILVLCLSSQNFKVLSCSKWFFHRYGSFKVSFFSPFYNLSNEKKKNKKKNGALLYLFPWNFNKLHIFDQTRSFTFSKQILTPDKRQVPLANQIFNTQK